MGKKTRSYLETIVMRTSGTETELVPITTGILVRITSEGEGLITDTTIRHHDQVGIHGNQTNKSLSNK